MIDIEDAAREEILFAFQLAHPRPVPADVADWSRRHPELRAAIVEHAALLLEADAVVEEDAVVPDDLLARGRSVTLDLLHRSRAESARRVPDGSASMSLTALLASAGKTVPALCGDIDAGRGMITDYVSGRMSPPVRMRLRRAVSGVLGVTIATIDAALDATLAVPLAARAKADGPAVVRVRSYDECVETDATMSDERRAYWLDPD